MPWLKVYRDSIKDIVGITIKKITIEVIAIMDIAKIC